MYDSVAWMADESSATGAPNLVLVLLQLFMSKSKSSSHLPNESSWLTQFCAEGVAAKRRYGATITPHIKHMHSFNEEDYPYYYNNNNKTI